MKLQVSELLGSRKTLFDCNLISGIEDNNSLINKLYNLGLSLNIISRFRELLITIEKKIEISVKLNIHE